MIKLSYKGENISEFMNNVNKSSCDGYPRVYVDMNREGGNWLKLLSSLEGIGYVPLKPVHIGGKSILQRVECIIHEPWSIDVILFI